MNIQNLSICVPANKCINDCKFCCCGMNESKNSDYEDCFHNLSKYSTYVEDLRKRMKWARDNGCNTLMLTGDNEPQQDIPFLKVFAEVNKSLENPFRNIEMQTTGAFIDESMLDFLKDSVGVTTIALSVACLYDNSINRELIGTKDKNLHLSKLCKNIKERGFNLRICINLSDCTLPNEDEQFKVSSNEYINTYCTLLNADQIMCRKLWASDNGSTQYQWINNNVGEKADSIFYSFKNDIKKNGKYIETLSYGLKRYDWNGFSVVADSDSMATDVKEDVGVKFLIIRPNGKMYSKWDSKASLIF